MRQTRNSVSWLNSPNSCRVGAGVQCPVSNNNNSKKTVLPRCCWAWLHSLWLVGGEPRTASALKNQNVTWQTRMACSNVCTNPAPTQLIVCASSLFRFLTIFEKLWGYFARLLSHKTHFSWLQRAVPASYLFGSSVIMVKIILTWLLVHLLRLVIRKSNATYSMQNKKVTWNSFLIIFRSIGLFYHT